MLINLIVPEELGGNPMALYERLLINAKWLQTMNMIPDEDYTYYYHSGTQPGIASEIRYWINENRADIAVLLALKGL